MSLTSPRTENTNQPSARADCLDDVAAPASTTQALPERLTDISMHEPLYESAGSDLPLIDGSSSPSNSEEQTPQPVASEQPSSTTCEPVVFEYRKSDQHREGHSPITTRTEIQTKKSFDSSRNNDSPVALDRHSLDPFAPSYDYHANEVSDLPEFTHGEVPLSETVDMKLKPEASSKLLGMVSTTIPTPQTEPLGDAFPRAVAELSSICESPDSSRLESCELNSSPVRRMQTLVITDGYHVLLMHRTKGPEASMSHELPTLPGSDPPSIDSFQLLARKALGNLPHSSKMDTRRLDQVLATRSADHHLSGQEMGSLPSIMPLIAHSMARRPVPDRSKWPACSLHRLGDPIPAHVDPVARELMVALLANVRGTPLEPTTKGPSMASDLAPGQYCDSQGYVHSSKILAVLEGTKKILCGFRSGFIHTGIHATRTGSAELDLIGGHREWSDSTDRHTAIRELAEEVMPSPARDRLTEQLRRLAITRSAVCVHPLTGRRHKIHYFAVNITQSDADELSLSENGRAELGLLALRSVEHYASSRSEDVWKEMVETIRIMVHDLREQPDSHRVSRILDTEARPLPQMSHLIAETPTRHRRASLLCHRWNSTSQTCEVLLTPSRGGLDLPSARLPTLDHAAEIEDIRSACVSAASKVFEDPLPVMRQLKMDQFADARDMLMEITGVVAPVTMSVFPPVRADLSPDDTYQSIWTEVSTVPGLVPGLTSTERRALSQLGADSQLRRNGASPAKITRRSRRVARFSRGGTRSATRASRNAKETCLARNSKIVTRVCYAQMTPRALPSDGIHSSQRPKKLSEGARMGFGTPVRYGRASYPTDREVEKRKVERVVPLHLAVPPMEILNWHHRMDPSIPLPHPVATERALRPEREVQPFSEEVSHLVASVAVQMGWKDAILDKPLMDRLLKATRDRARSRGSERITLRDVRDAADLCGSAERGVEVPTVQTDLPVHWDEILCQLSSLSKLASSLHRKPRVLIVGETRAILARLFLEAGADVATCDLQDSESPEIPHFKGDSSLIQDLGWDLVIAHPPCTYLSNAGVMWLTREKGRVDRAADAAALFRRIQATKAPFVAIEQPVMHRLARQLTASSPAQIVHPWQHGTGHTKPTALHLSVDLPLIVPTCVVPGRLHKLASLPQSSSRGNLRSRTYEGVAAAMVTQWSPVLFDYIKNQTPNDDLPTAIDLVRQARASPCVASVTRSVPYHCRHNRPVLQLMARECEDPSVTTALPQFLAEGTSRRTAHGLKARLEEKDDEGPHTPVPYTRGIGDWAAGTASLATRDLRACTDTACRRDANRYGNTSLPNLHDWRDSSRRLCSPEVVAAPFQLPQSVAPASNTPYRVDSQPHPWTIAPMLPVSVTPSPRHARRRYGKWHVWRERAGPNTPAASWQPITGLDADHFDEIARRYGGLAKVRESELTDGMRRVWECPAQEFDPGQSVPRLPLTPKGLIGRHTVGSPHTATSSKLPDLRLYQKGLADAHRAEFRASFRSAGVALPPITAPSVVVAAIPHSEPYSGRLDAKERSGLRSPMDVSPFSEDDILPAFTSQEMETKGLYPLVTAPHCAFLQDMVIARPHNRPHGPKGYLIDRACLQVNRALADSGAGPSMITDEYIEIALESNPGASISIDYSPASHGDPNVVGPDGNLLEIIGVATIDFTLSGRAYTHKFLVVIGSPLLILGNDFLSLYHGDVCVRPGEAGYLVLTHQGKRVCTPLSIDPPKIDAVGTSIVALINPAISPIRQDGEILPPSKRATLPPLEVASSEEAIQQTFKTTEYMLYAEKPIKLAPRDEGIVWVPVPMAQRHLPGPFYVQPLPHRPGIRTIAPVSTGLVWPVDGKLPIGLNNLQRHYLHIPAFDGIAMICTEFESQEMPVDGPTPRKFSDLNKEQQIILVGCPAEGDKPARKGVEIDPSGVLTPKQREVCLDMLATFIDVFAPNPKSPTHTHLMEVDLPLKPGTVPHCHQSSRQGEAGRAIIDKECAEMEANGIIRKSNSPWGSRVVLITKKDGSIRFCVDYRDTNAKLMPFDSPIPRCEDAIDRLASGKGPIDSLFLSVMDLASGFWTLPIAEESKAQTAFVTHRQKYEWNYLPFGIQSGPSWMCRLVDAALSGLAWESCIPYLDDTAVWSTGKGDTPLDRQNSSFEQMLRRLTAVLERFRWAGLSPKASKCTIFATSADFLGHVVSREGLKMDPKKIDTVRNIDPKGLNTVEKVRSFLGLVSYYRRFIDKFTEHAAPLYDLTKDGCDVATASQSALCQASFMKLIDAITGEPVLAMPRFDRPFLVKTDGACTHGIGAVLVQRDDDDHERPVCYYGRKLIPAERNYTVTEVELLAVVEAVKHWRPYLWGKRFTIITDHSALRWLHTMKDTVDGGPSSRLTRWNLRLQEYDFSVEHKPGRHHHDADAVSRLVNAIRTSSRSDSASGHLLHCRTAVAEYLASADLTPDELAKFRNELTDFVTGVSEVCPKFKKTNLEVEPMKGTQATRFHAMVAAAESQCALRLSLASVDLVKPAMMQSCDFHTKFPDEDASVAVSRRNWTDKQHNEGLVAVLSPIERLWNEFGLIEPAVRDLCPKCKVGLLWPACENKAPYRCNSLECSSGTCTYRTSDCNCTPETATSAPVPRPGEKIPYFMTPSVPPARPGEIRPALPPARPGEMRPPPRLVAKGAPQVKATRRRVATERSLQKEDMAKAAAETSRASIIRSYARPNTLDNQALREAQSEDADCRDLMAALVTTAASGELLTKRSKWIQRQLHFLDIRDGILERVDPPKLHTVVERRRPWVPVEVRYRYLVAFHDRAGHQGRDRTYHLLNDRYYWPGLARDVNEYVRECHECTFAKRLPMRHSHATVPGVSEQPFDTMVVDIVDMALTGDGLHDKCIVFVDQLTRWVECVPVLGEPTMEKLYDIFMTEVVCRHGMPRIIRNDLGGNLAGKLTSYMHAQGGTDRSPSAAHHHQSAGVAERFNGTLVGMCRAANQGGAHWRDHLPFLLFSYRATPHRVTKLSPAQLLYGRELRLPAQVDSSIATGPTSEMVPHKLQEYAVRLHRQLKGAWAAARDLSVDEQLAGRDREDRRTDDPVYKVDDRVCYQLPDKVNKLQWQWAGPCRIKEVLDDGNYTLRDLASGLTSDRIPSARLRPYRTWVDEDDLDSDEYLIERLLKVKGQAPDRQFFVKWRQYPISGATWEPEYELRRRCSDLIAAFDSGANVSPDDTKPKAGWRKKDSTRSHSKDETNETRPEETPSSDQTKTPATEEYIDELDQKHLVHLLCVDGTKVFTYRGKSNSRLPEGIRRPNETNASAMLRSLQDSMSVPSALLDDVRQILSRQPSGQTQIVDPPEEGGSRTVSHVWAVRVTPAMRENILTLGPPMGFTPLDDAISEVSQSQPQLGRACRQALQQLEVDSPTPKPPTVATELPYEARYVRGAWAYLHLAASARGSVPRWHPQHYFDENSSSLLTQLRDEYRRTLTAKESALVPRED